MIVHRVVSGDFSPIGQRAEEADERIEERELRHGGALWFVYGLLIGAWPVVLANGLTLLLAASILAMKLKYR